RPCAARPPRSRRVRGTRRRDRLRPCVARSRARGRSRPTSPLDARRPRSPAGSGQLIAPSLSSSITEILDRRADHPGLGAALPRRSRRLGEAARRLPGLSGPGTKLRELRRARDAAALLAEPLDPGAEVLRRDLVGQRVTDQTRVALG